MAARTRSTSPLVMPPSMPPARSVRRAHAAVPVAGRSRRGPPSRGGAAVSSPSPTSTALTDWTPMSAPASRESSRRSQCTWLPRPGGRPWTTTSMTPPRVSPFFRTSSISATIARAGRRVGAAHRVLVDARVVVRARAARRRARHRADRHDVADHLDAERLAQERLRDRAERHPGGGLAGAGPLEHRPGVVEAVLLHAGEVGVPGARAGQRRVAGLTGQHLGVDRVGGHHRRPTSATRCCRSGSRSGRPGCGRAARRR